ncbi:MAG: glycosyltransferase 87 family protein [Solirubrobacteraceae bacterium]
MSSTALALTARRTGSRRRAAWAAARARPGPAVGLAVLSLALPLLIAGHHAPTLALPSARAQAAVRADPQAGPVLERLRPLSGRALPIDATHDSVWFYRGARVVFEAIVARDGRVTLTADPSAQAYAYGSNITNQPAVLLLLACVFVLMGGVWPLWRLRNLDVLLAAASTTTIVLLNQGRLGAMAACGAGLLGYFGGRFAWTGLRPSARPGPSIPLFEALAGRWTSRQQIRMLRLLAAAAGLILAMTAISSREVVDVGYAVMEGATYLVHGVLPYGHGFPGILHGDTYPIGSYVLYAPFAALAPVRDSWDSADTTLYVALAAALLGAAMIWGFGAVALVNRRPRRSRRPELELARLRAVVGWLTFPALAVTVSTGSSDVVLAVALLGALVLWRRPAACAGLLSAGAWFKLVPLILLGVCLAPLRGRRLYAAASAVAGVCAVMLAVLLAAGGVGGVSAMVRAIGYQNGRVSPQSIWLLLGSVPGQQIVQALTLALLAGVVVRLRRDPSLAADRPRMAAIGGALIVGLQLSASYWTYLYLTWLLPFLALSVIGSSGERDQP